MTKLLKCENLHGTLRELNLGGFYKISSENCELLTKFRTLEILGIEYVDISPDAFLNLLKCENLRKSLRKLTLYGIKNLSKEHVEAISYFDNLKFLSIGGCNLSFSNLKQYKKSKKTEHLFV
ncbi:hypothetical protein EQH57_0004 [Dictyocoela roeselum]|nr:hypothetical protein EQH57_0004 [Dictyocoela roeselum]